MVEMSLYTLPPLPEGAGELPPELEQWRRQVEEQLGALQTQHKELTDQLSEARQSNELIELKESAATGRGGGGENSLAGKFDLSEN